MKVCPDCLITPPADQRAASRNGRCRFCIRSLFRDAQKRMKARNRADETTTPVYGL